MVGYTSTSAEQGKFLILGAGFEDMNGTMKLNDLVSGVVGVDFGDGTEFKSTAAQVQIPVSSGNGYNIYYYLNDGWYDNGTTDGDFKPGWCDGFGSLVDVDITPGVAFWFKSVPGDASAVIAGVVPETSTDTVSCPVTFALRANTFPCEISINGTQMTSSDIVGVDFGDGTSFKTTAAQLQVPVSSGNGYNIYYYLNDGWYDNGTTDGDFKPGWCDGFGSIVDATIPAAQGFWTKGVSGAFTLEFNK